MSVACASVVGCGGGDEPDLPRTRVAGEDLPGDWKRFEEPKILWTFRYPPSYELRNHDELDAQVADGDQGGCAPGNKRVAGDSLDDATRQAGRLYGRHGLEAAGLRVERTANGDLGRFELRSTETHDLVATIAVFDSMDTWDTLVCGGGTAADFARRRREFDQIVRSLRS